METVNIPIYRAKVIGLDNDYIIGFYQQYIEGFEDNVFHEINNTLIDQTTLAIHFPDMLDSQGNKIFASLSEDGKGGDSILIEAFREELQKGYCIYKNGRFHAVDAETDTFDILETELEIKVIGIQK